MFAYNIIQAVISCMLPIRLKIKIKHVGYYGKLLIADFSHGKNFEMEKKKCAVCDAMCTITNEYHN